MCLVTLFCRRENRFWTQNYAMTDSDCIRKLIWGRIAARYLLHITYYGYLTKKSRQKPSLTPTTTTVGPRRTQWVVS
jgi:hypothetical protein